MAVDYSAIAKKYGGVPVSDNQNESVDYEAISKKYGGVVVQPTQPQVPQPIQPTQKQETTAGGLVSAAGRGAAPYAAVTALGSLVPGGVVAAPTALFAADTITTLVNSVLGTGYKTPSESVQGLLTLAGTPNADTEAERIVQAISGGAASTSAFTGLGKTLLGSANPLAQRVGQVLSESPLAQYFGGAGAAGAGQAVAEAGGGPVPQVLASLLGGVGGVRAGQAMSPRPNVPVVSSAAEVPISSTIPAMSMAPNASPQRQALQSFVQEGEKQNIPILTSNVFPPETQTAKTSVRLGANVPFVGTGKTFQSQQEARANRIKGVLQEYNAENIEDLSRDLTDDAIKTFDDIVTKNKNDKKSVIGGITNKMNEQKTVADERLGKKTTLAESEYQKKLDEYNKQLNERQYAEQYGLPNKPPMPEKPLPPTIAEQPYSEHVVPLPNVLRSLDEKIAEFEARNNAPSTQTANALKALRQDLQKTGRNLSQTEALRKDVFGKQFSVSPTEVVYQGAQNDYAKATKELYSSLNDDLGNFIKKNGSQADYDKWKIANKNISDALGEFDKESLATAFNKGNATPEKLTDLLFSRKLSDIESVERVLSQEGKQNAKRAILSKIAEKAASSNPDGSISYNPNVFLTELNRLKKQMGVFFKGKDLAQLEGLSRILSGTKLAQEIGTVTATGQAGVPFTVGGLLVSLFGSLGTFGTIAVKGLSSRIYESPRVRDYLIKIRTAPKNSKKEKYLIDQLFNVIKAENAKVPVPQQQQQEGEQ
jgi:hypothetical protein